MQRLEVHKFGGTSVADHNRMLSATGLIAALREQADLVVVSSATSGTTDQLQELGEIAAAGDDHRVNAICDAIASRHLMILKELGGDPEDDLGRAIGELIAEMRQLTEAAAIQRELTPRVYDRILITGEKLAVRLMARAFANHGASAVACDADQFLETDDNFGSADVVPGVSDRTIRTALQKIIKQGAIPVVTGFCGRAPDGATTTLGRGGSDYTATLLAAALRADEVTIWTDVDGVFTANPKVVPSARVIRQLNYREAAEMSYYGAKVLHQRTMIPVIDRGIAVWTKNSHHPRARGTVVDGRFTPGSHPVKAVSAIHKQALLSIEGKGMAGVPGFAARLFAVLAQPGSPVLPRASLRFWHTNGSISR